MKGDRTGSVLLPDGATRRGFLGAGVLGAASAVFPAKASAVRADEPEPKVPGSSGLKPPHSAVIATSTGQRIKIGDWPGADPPIVFAPGLTSHHRGIGAVAHQLHGKRRVVSLDLRGRGNSTKPEEGHYGMQAHAEDLLAVMDALGIERAVMAGHSMGAYVATAAAVHAPQRTAGLVLIDGGIALPGFVGPHVQADALLQSILGPVIERLTRTFKSANELRTIWKATGHLPENEIGEDYINYDIGIVKGGYRSKCSPIAARDDCRDMVNNTQSVTRIEKVKCPVLAVAAEHGIGHDGPPILPPVALQRLQQAVGDHRVLHLPGFTHYTCVLSHEGAAKTAAELHDFVNQLI